MHLFTKVLLGHLLVILVTGASVALIAGLVSPGLYKTQLDQVAVLLRPEFSLLRLTLEGGYRKTIIQALSVAVPVSLVLAAGLAYFQTKRLLAGIRRLADGSREIARGHYRERLDIQGNDELAELATDFNQMADALERAEKKRVELIGIVAHEINTPLTVQQGYAEALTDALVSPEEAARAIVVEVNVMRRLTHDLLLVTKAETGSLELVLATYGAATFVEDALDRFTVAFDEKGLELKAELSGKLTPVFADRERVGQVLGNLLSNALRYTSGPGQVTLRARPCAGCVEFSVTDTGPGIAEEQQTLVFHRFHRAEAATRNDGGTGIGLTVSRGLVKAMGGRIWLESRFGHGTTFYFTLPVANSNRLERNLIRQNRPADALDT